MSSIGSALRNERLRRKWSLERVSKETKISRNLLEAIENDAFERLPGMVFARNFVRQYARLMGLDEEELARELRRTYEVPAEAATVPESQQPPSEIRDWPSLRELEERVRVEGHLSAVLWLLLAVAACTGAYFIGQRGRSTPTRTTASAPASPTAARPALTEPAAMNRTAPVDQAAVPANPSYRLAEISDSGVIRVPGAPAAQALPEATRSAPKAAPSQLRVLFSASEPVWVSIKADGNRVFSGTLGAKQTRQQDASKKITVLVGNAGGLKIVLNGKQVPAVGTEGEIRLLVLTPAGVQVVPRTPPTPPTPEGSTASDAPAARL